MNLSSLPLRGSVRSIVRGVLIMRQIKIVIEQHPDGYVAYPLEMRGVVVGEGDTSEEALQDVQSAIKFHIETFG
jgi:hypothetical protein